VLVYEDGHGTWWSDVVFRKGKHNLQCGISCTSEQQAIACLESQIAEIKATREHGAVAEGRRMGVNYDACLWLGVQHKELGYRYVKRRIDGIRSDGFEFLRKHGIAENAGEAEMRHAETLARDTVLLYAPHFNSPDCYPTLEPPADTDKSEEEIKSWQEAASFLLGRGIADINDRHEPAVIYRHVLCVPDKTASVLTMSGLQKAT
jgi:hypothetical protein